MLHAIITSAEVAEPSDNGSKPLKPWAKMNLSFFIFSGFCHRTESYHHILRHLLFIHEDNFNTMAHKLPRANKPTTLSVELKLYHKIHRLRSSRAGRILWIHVVGDKTDEWLIKLCHLALAGVRLGHMLQYWQTLKTICYVNKLDVNSKYYMTVHPMPEVPRIGEFRLKVESLILGRGSGEWKLAFTE